MPFPPSRLGLMKNLGVSMEFTDWEKERLIGTSDIVEDAKRAFQRNDWFGAFARVHCMIEFWMQEISELDSRKSQTTERVEYLNKHYFYGYWRLTEETRRLGYITDEEARRLVEFGRSRNRIFHRLVKHHYSAAHYEIVHEKEVEKAFEEGLALESLVRERLRKLTLDNKNLSSEKVRDSTPE